MGYCRDSPHLAHLRPAKTEGRDVHPLAPHVARLAQRPTSDVLTR